MRHGDGLHGGQRIAHMQGALTDSLTHAEGTPLPEVDRRLGAEDASGPERGECYTRSSRQAIMGLCEDGGQSQQSLKQQSRLGDDDCRAFPKSDGGWLQVDDDEENHGMRPALAGRGGLPEHLPGWPQAALDLLPNELLFHILSFLDVCDLLSTSRVNRLLRQLSLAPLLHRYRLQRNRLLLPPLLSSPCRPSLPELIARSIFLTKTSVVSKRLARSLVSIRLSRRLAARPSVEALVDRAVIPRECVPGMKGGLFVAPGLLAKRKEVEKERMKDMLRRWVDGKWRGEVRVREEDVRRTEEKRGVGRVWRLRRFWERVSRGDIVV